MLNLIVLLIFLALVREIIKQTNEYYDKLDDALERYQQFGVHDLSPDFYNHVSELKKERTDMRGCWNPVKRYNYIVRYIQGDTYTPYIKNLMMNDDRFFARGARTYLKGKWR